MKTQRARQKDAGSKSGQKGKYKNQDKHRWRKVFVWIFLLPFAVFLPLAFTQGRYVKWWIALCVLNAAWYTVFLLEWYVYTQTTERRRLRIIAGTLSVIVVIVGFVWTPKVQQPFLARIPTAPLGSYTSNPRGGVFWAIYNRGTGDVVTPAELGLFVEIVNQQGREALIDSYTVEAQNNSGKWFKLIRVDATTSPVFLCFEGGDLREAKPLDLINGLDRVLKDKAIPAYSTVRGWAFFELPQNIRESSPFRITVEDNTGVIAQNIDDRAEPVKDYVQSGDLHLAGGLKDLTGYRFMRYSNLFKERIPN